MFAKYWESGRVKSRLAARVGSAAASRVYESFVALLVERFAATADQRWLAFTPLQRRDAFVRLAGDSWQLWPQPEGDLGGRMSAFFADTQQHGARQTVLIGSDSPTLPAGFVFDAFHLLRDYDAVLGPAADGGYYLIGASRPLTAVFHDVPWSTPDVTAITLRRLAAAGLTCALLPEWYDVDEWDDLCRLHEELSQRASPSPRWSALGELVAGVLKGRPEDG